MEKQEADDFAQYEGFKYMEASALTSKNVDECMMKLLHQLHDYREKEKGLKLTQGQGKEADMSILPENFDEDSAIRLDRQGIKSVDASKKSQSCC